VLAHCNNSSRTPQQSSEPEDIYWNGDVSTSNLSGGRRGRDCMVVGFTTTCGISAYHHLSREFMPLGLSLGL
jgi:hypothetical protein